MRRRVSIMLGLLFFLALGGRTSAELESEHEIAARVLLSGDIEVKETITFRGEVGRTPLSRSFWIVAAQDAWPLQKEVRNVSVEDEKGHKLRFRERAYEDRSNVDFLEIPSSGVIVLRYTINRPLMFNTAESKRLWVAWHWTVSYRYWNAKISQVSVHLSLPNTATTEEAAFQYSVGYGAAEDIHLEPTREGGVAHWTFSPNSSVSSPVFFSLAVLAAPVDSDVDSKLYWQDLAELTRLPLLALALLVLLALVLILLRSRVVVVATRFTNFLPAIPALYSAYCATRFWYLESGSRGAGNDLSGEFIVNFGLAGFVVLFAWQQYKTLATGSRAAYFSQLAYPAVLLVAWPIAIVDRSMIVFPLLAFPVYLYWPRKKIALHFGVGAHRIAEEVISRAEISVEQLANELGISQRCILRALEQNPHLPVVHDHAKAILLSADAAAMHEEFRVCTSCGGATEVAGMALLKCGYCQREYHDGGKQAAKNPIPVVVETLAILFETLAKGGFYFAAVLALAILIMDTLAGNLGEAVVGAALTGGLLCVPAGAFLALAEALRSGHGLGWAKVFLLCFAWLVAPLFVLLKLQSRRVCIYFGDFDTKRLASQLEKAGEWSLKEFADYLQCNQEDAAELARYFAVNQIVDMVYDQRESRLVCRSRYREIATEASCDRCGGYYGVSEGKATCHFCGGSPSEA